MTHSHAWRDSFVHATWLILTCEIFFWKNTQGKSRSACVVAAYLIRKHHFTVAQGVAKCCRVLHSVAGCGRVLQSVAECCRATPVQLALLQPILSANSISRLHKGFFGCCWALWLDSLLCVPCRSLPYLQTPCHGATRCIRVLQSVAGVAECCSVLQCVAVSAVVAAYLIRKHDFTVARGLFFFVGHYGSLLFVTWLIFVCDLTRVIRKHAFTVARSLSLVFYFLGSMTRLILSCDTTFLCVTWLILSTNKHSR